MTKKGRASLNADDLIKHKNLINELTFSRVIKKSYKYAYIIYKLNPTPITFYVAPNQCDYWETLNVRYLQEKQTYL